MTAMAQSLQTYAAAARLLAGGWRWWRAEILAMIPVSVRQSVSGRRETALLLAGGDRTILRITATGEEFELPRDGTPAQGAPRIARSTRATVCALPDAVLRTVITLPAAVEENLGEVLSFEVDRHTPFAAADVWIAHRILGRDRAKGNIDVELAAAPRRVVGEALAAAGRLGLIVETLDLSEPVGSRTLVARLDGSGGRAAGALRGWRFRAWVPLLGTMLLLAAATTVVPVLRTGREITVLREQVAAARLAATKAAETEKEIDRLSGDTTFLADRRRQDVRAIDILAEVTRRLPDGTWLDDLTLDAHDLGLAGYTDSSSGLIQQLTRSKLIADPHFESPVTIDATSGLERFAIRAHRAPLKAGSP